MFSVFFILELEAQASTLVHWILTDHGQVQLGHLSSAVVPIEVNAIFDFAVKDLSELIDAFILGSHVVEATNVVKVLDHLKQTVVTFVTKVMLHRYSVLQVYGEGVDVVVNQKDVLEFGFTSCEDLKVFENQGTSWVVSQLAGMMAVETMLDQLTSGVQKVNNGVSKPLDSRSEDSNLKMLVGKWQALLHIRPHWEACPVLLIRQRVDDGEGLVNLEAFLLLAISNQTPL